MPAVVSSPQLAQAPTSRWLRRIAVGCLGLYLVLLLGANSVAEAGGPLTWLPFWRLPTAHSVWTGVGPVSLLPVLSMVAWLAHRWQRDRFRSVTPGWWQVYVPLGALAGVAILSLSLTCFTDACSPSSFARLALLAAHVAWVYLLIVNEKPDLFWVVVAIIALQSATAVGQFLAQRDLGLHFLGELPLDPQVSGISVVMRGDLRWLRGYGLTIHPNITAQTLVPCLLLLIVLGRQATRLRRAAAAAAFTLGLGGMMVTLARWAWACLVFGFGLVAFGWLWCAIRDRRQSVYPEVVATGAAALLLGLLFLGAYADALAGRAVVTSSAIESRSVSERQRDVEIASRLLAERPWLGVGFGNYLAAATERDASAKIVHNTPLWFGAEMGWPGVLLWFGLLLGPLLRRGALTRYAPVTALWLSIWLLGLLYAGPHPLSELRSALLAGMIGGYTSLSGRAA